MDDNENVYELKQDDIEYILSINLLNNNILRFSCSRADDQDDTQYENDFTMNDLRSLDRAFSEPESLYQVQEILDNAIKEQKVGLSDENDVLNVIFYIAVGGNSNIVVPLYKQNKNDGGNFHQDNNDDFNIFPNNNKEDPVGGDYNDNKDFHSKKNSDNNNNNPNSSSNKKSKNNLYPEDERPDENYHYNPNKNYIFPDAHKKKKEPEKRSNFDPYSDVHSRCSCPIDDARLDRLEFDRDNIKNNHNLLKSDLRKLADELIDLRRKNKDFNNYKNELTKTKRENVDLRNENNNLKNIINKLREEKDKDNSTKEELDAVKNENNNLKKQINELKNENDRLRDSASQIPQLINENDSLKNKISQIPLLQNENDSLRGQNNKLSYDNNQLKLENDDLKNKLQSLQNSLNNNNNLRSAPKTTKESLPFKSSFSIGGGRPSLARVKGEIIHSKDELELLTHKINNNNSHITFNLIYKATVDSDKAASFHSKCDKAKASLVLIETDKGRRFGGFTKCSWDGDCEEKEDKEAFIFNLDNKKIYANVPGDDAIGCYPKFGAVFLGCQIRIYDEAFKNGGSTFEKGLNFDTLEDYEINEGERTFGIKEIEVYEVVLK